ncbi:MAG: yidA [Pedosphaera sp.]|nr:yidA [Pedosphaera sp.]
MTKATAHPRFKLAAIDLDGTLLGPDLKISPENLQALRALHERKIEIVIASGRHYLSVRPFLQSLPEVQWIVSVQGGEISNRDRNLILARNFMDKAHVELALDQAIHLGLSPVAYGTEGVFTHLPGNEDLGFYEHLSGLAPVQTSRSNLMRIPVFKVLWLGQPGQISIVMAAPSPSRAFERVQTHRQIVEFVPNDVTKATGLQTLATRLRISPKEAVVFGDAENYVPMFKWAGLSVAMAHGWPTAIENASKTSTAGSPETALARAISSVMDGCLQ